MRKKQPTTRFGKIRQWINGIYQVILPNKTEYENVLQYIVRQFYMCDSNGKPSLTVTILVYVMILVAIVTAVECQIALSPIQIVNAAGVIVKTQLQGFSTGFLSLIISLSVVITTFYRWKKSQEAVKTDGAAEDMGKGIVDKIKDYIGSVLGTIGGGKTPPTPPAPPSNQGPVGK